MTQKCRFWKTPSVPRITPPNPPPPDFTTWNQVGALNALEGLQNAIDYFHFPCFSQQDTLRQLSPSQILSLQFPKQHPFKFSNFAICHHMLTEQAARRHRCPAHRPVCTVCLRASLLRNAVCTPCSRSGLAPARTETVPLWPASMWHASRARSGDPSASGRAPASKASRALPLWAFSADLTNAPRAARRNSCMRVFGAAAAYGC